MQVTVLGSGTALPTARRASSGYLVEWSGGALLLDPSPGSYTRALKAGLDPHRLVCVALTHFHPDHAGDLVGVLWARRQMEDLATALLLAGPDGTAALLNRFRALHEGLADEPVVEVRGYPFEHGGLGIEAFSAHHVPESVCLRLRADGRTLSYSGDTGDCDGLRAACRGADLALLECSAMEPSERHLSPEECAAIVAAERPAHVLLTHLGPGVSSDLPMAEDGLVVGV